MGGVEVRGVDGGGIVILASYKIYFVHDNLVEDPYRGCLIDSNKKSYFK